MSRRRREWFRDDDGDWRIPDGRRGEAVSLALYLPTLAVIAHYETGLPRPTANWPAAIAGVWCGFLYATSYRTALIEHRTALTERVPDRVPLGWVSSVLASGLGLSVLRFAHVADPTLTFLFAAGGTVLAIYLVRSCSPLHPGLEPPRRGVEPPPADETERRRGTRTETERQTSATTDR